MSTLKKPLKEWSEDDLKALIRDGVEENTRLEYKRELDLSKSGRKEVCRDISAFANSQGGILIYGIEEEAQKELGSIPKDIKPLTDASIKETIENILLNSISPPITFWIYTIEVSGGFCLAIQIPQSLSTHMVTLGHDNRYYIRRNFQRSPMTEDEVKAHYERSLKTKEDLTERYLKERTDVSMEEPLVQLVVIPVTSHPRFIDRRRIGPQDLKHDNKGYIGRFLDQIEYEVKPNEFYLGNPNQPLSRINISGTCEFCYHFNTPKGFPSKTILLDLHNYLRHCALVFQTIGYHGPVKIFYRLVGTGGKFLDVGGFDSLPYRNIDMEMKEFFYDTESHVDILLMNPWPVIHEIMDHVWIFFTYEQGCDFFDEEGRLKPGVLK